MNIKNIKEDIFSYYNLFCLFGPLSERINLLNKLEIIQYNGIRIPRIPLDKNNALNLDQFFYGPKKQTDLIRQLNKNDIYNKYDTNLNPSLKNDDNKNDNLKEKENFKMINNDKNNLILNNDEYLLPNNNVFYIKNESQIQYPSNTSNNDLLKDKNNIILFPPKKFISIINNDNNDINNNKDILNKNNKINYININNIILYNINRLSNNNYLTLNNCQTPINNNLYYKNNSNNSNHYYKPLYNSYNLKVIPNLISLTLNTSKNKNKNSKLLFKVDTPSISTETNKILFNKITKRGRKAQEIKENKKTHLATDDDNILRKIQVHFISFVTNFVNDVIKTFITGKNIPFFKKIDYKIKKTVNHRYVEELKSKNLAEILQLRVSPKMKIHDDSVNKNIYNKVCLLCPFMSGFLQRSYLSLFKEYYYNKTKIFIVNGKIIPLSIKTKTFNDLINKNYAYKEKLKYIAVNYFLNNYKRSKRPGFKPNDINKNLIKEDEKE